MTQSLKEKFEEMFVGPGGYVEATGEAVFQFIQNEIITPLEKENSDDVLDCLKSIKEILTSHDKRITAIEKHLSK